jgi:hypothetical protein
MAINYTYPVKTVPTDADDILIIDNADPNKATKKVTISSLPISAGVTSIVAGTDITISPVSGLGDVTINSSGTVTSVTGTLPISSSGGTTPAISIATSNASTTGALTGADWTTFNNKTSNTGTVTTVTGTSPVVSTGGTTPVVSMPAATTSASGHLTSTDWNTFDGKTNNLGTVTTVTGTSPIVSSGGTTPAISLGTVPINKGGTGLSTIGVNNTILTSNGTTASWSTTALSGYLPLAGGTMTGAITSSSSITALQLIPADVALVIATGASGNQDLVLYDTALGTFSNLDITGSGIPIVEFYINSLAEGATATLFLTTSASGFVQPAAWQTIPSGGVATPILWPGGTPPVTTSAGIYKFTFTMAGGIVYGVADLAFA